MAQSLMMARNEAEDALPKVSLERNLTFRGVFSVHSDKVIVLWIGVVHLKISQWGSSNDFPSVFQLSCPFGCRDATPKRCLRFQVNTTTRSMVALRRFSCVFLSIWKPRIHFQLLYHAFWTLRLRSYSTFVKLSSTSCLQAFFWFTHLQKWSKSLKFNYTFKWRAYSPTHMVAR